MNIIILLLTIIVQLLSVKKTEPWIKCDNNYYKSDTDIICVVENPLKNPVKLVINCGVSYYPVIITLPGKTQDQLIIKIGNTEDIINCDINNYEILKKKR